MAISLMLSIRGYGQESSDIKEEVTTKISEGQFVFDGRLRYWYGNNESLSESHATTFGTNFGYLTKSYKGFQIYIEGESVVALTPDLYFDGVNDQVGRTVVTDVETLEFNKARVAYNDTIKSTYLQLKVGRQAAIVEDERFIGNISARMDDQTFDAIYGKLQNDKKGVRFEYAYMYKINRLLAEIGDWRSDSHAFTFSYNKSKMARVSFFSLLLDFQDDAPERSNQTFGITIDRSYVPEDRMALKYKTAFAWQSEYGDNPTSYESFLVNAEIGISVPKTGVFSIGYELATSDDGLASFQFPLSTGQRLHRISDVFIDPPTDGLHNPYFTAEAPKLFWGIGGWLGYHAYLSEERNNSLGQEIDVVLYRPLVPGLLRAELTYSSFFAQDDAYADLDIFALDLVLQL
ncbi:MAG: alginate export family protein [Bacteroidota bacterium]